MWMAAFFSHMARDQTKPEEYSFAETYGLDVDRGREELLFGEHINWNRDQNSDVSGGIIRMDDSEHAPYDGIPLPTLKKLIERNYVSEDQCQNSCPTVGELLDHAETLVEEYGVAPDDVRFIAYVKSPYRRDAGFSIVGLYVTDTGDSTFGKLDLYFGQHFGHPDDDHYKFLDGERNLRGKVSVWWD